MVISDQSPSQCVDLVLMLSDQGGKGGTVAFLRPGDELGLSAVFDL
jgi:hypothetical protein